jgi:hypothetical protein
MPNNDNARTDADRRAEADRIELAVAAGRTTAADAARMHDANDRKR